MSREILDKPNIGREILDMGCENRNKDFPDFLEYKFELTRPSFGMLDFRDPCPDFASFLQTFQTQSPDANMQLGSESACAATHGEILFQALPEHKNRHNYAVWVSVRLRATHCTTHVQFFKTFYPDFLD